MCQSNAYIIKKDGQEKMIMEDVSLITPQENGSLILTGLFGDQLILSARIKEMDLLKHKILLQEE